MFCRNKQNKEKKFKSQLEKGPRQFLEQTDKRIFAETSIKEIPETVIERETNPYKSFSIPLLLLIFNEMITQKMTDIGILF